MKVKLLKKLRQIGRNKINIHSVTTTNGVVTGMKYGYDFDEYRRLFNYGDTEEDMKRKACNIYLKLNIDYLREKYAKYSVKYRR